MPGKKAAPVRAIREQQDRDDFDLVLSAYKMHGYTKGAKGIYMALLHMDPPRGHEPEEDPPPYEQI